jgi:hypothetical protein
MGSSLARDNCRDKATVGALERRLRIGRFNLFDNFNNIEVLTGDSKEDDPDNPSQKKQVC